MKNYEFLNDLKSGKFADMVKEEMKGEILNNSKEVFNVMRPLFGKGADTESMYCVFMNAKNKVISIELICEGTLSASPVYPREIIKRALKAKAAAILMVHNHPSGDPAPSPEDNKLTFTMVIAASSMGMTLHEHIIIGENKYFSYADMGMMHDYTTKYKKFIS